MAIRCKNLMLYYWLVTALAYLLVLSGLAAALVFIFWLNFIYDHADNSIVIVGVGVFFLGIATFQLRGLVVDHIAEQVSECGDETAATLVMVERFNRENLVGSGPADWYLLIVEMRSLEDKSLSKKLCIEQLFKSKAAEWLKTGNVIRVKFSYKMQLAIVVHEDAYTQLSSGPQFKWFRPRLGRYPMSTS